MEFICDNEKENWEPGDEAKAYVHFKVTTAVSVGDGAKGSALQCFSLFFAHST